MKLLVFSTADEARAGDQRALALLKQDTGANGGQWSGVFCDDKTPPRYAIFYADEIAPAFTAAELARVEDGDRVKRDQGGQIISGNWDIYTPPSEVSP